MAGYIKGIYSYIRPESNTEATPPLSPTTPSAADPPSPTANNVCQLEGNPQEAGYLRRAVTGVASGIYSVDIIPINCAIDSVFHCQTVTLTTMKTRQSRCEGVEGSRSVGIGGGRENIHNTVCASSDVSQELR
ncbi:hypothetical protein E2C01_022777 [Portunus trituberculatus]|uniref:Uncharacterized protein n=1 Tax=Portunus trituberculatus TaxID=210409 RepID=A0A5B7E6X9_PORTR|nr:hypothetical protein [Portunus trituberculatus]